MNNSFFVFLCSLIVTATLTPTQASAAQVQISGSVQFWQRSCTTEYRCGVPAAVGDRIALLEMISPPLPGSSLSYKTLVFSFQDFSGQLGIYWKKSATESFLSGQSLLTKDGVRIAECSQYSTDQVPTFIPVGFCAGYVHTDVSITQFGMTYYK